MDNMELIKRRHSVRQYRDVPIEEETLTLLREEIALINKESGLNFQLVTNEPKAFSGKMAKYGKFENVSNYIALVGKKSPDLDELCGYYGERIVLKAQELGLNTCWVALTYTKVPGAYRVEKGEKLTVVISVGYGRHRGLLRSSKTANEVSNADEVGAEWFRRGVEAALLAPSAMNQQKFYFKATPEGVLAKAGVGFYTKMDLGIAKYHFELGAGRKNFTWIKK